QRTVDKGVLLFQAQLLALPRFIIGIKNFSDVLGINLLVDGADIIAGVEGFEIESFSCFRLPEAERIGRRISIDEYRGFLGIAVDDAVRYTTHFVTSLCIGISLCVTAQFYLDDSLRLPYLPGISPVQPFVGNLDLPSIAEHLIEYAEFISDTKSDGRYFQ